MRKGRRLPSIAFTLTLVGTLLLIPYIAVSALQWEDSLQQVENAVRVDESAKRLDLLLRLSPALNTELLSIGFTAGGSDLVSEIPEAAIPFLDFDLAGSLDEDRAAVDQLLEQLGEPALLDAIVAARAGTEGEDIVITDLGFLYGDLRSEVDTMIQNELITLSSAASATGEAQISRAARLAETAADVRVASVGLDTRWAQIIAADYAPPSSEDVQLFVYGVKNLDEMSSVFDAAVPPEGDLCDQWAAINESDAYATLLAEYQATTDQVASTGVATGTVQEIDLSDLELLEALTLASRISIVFQAADEVNVGLERVVDSALEDLRSESGAAVERATDQRRQTILGLLATGIFLLLAVLGLAWLIGRPIRLMADAARKMSKGDLDVHVPERGPAEILVGSRALNQAISSLRTTEAQAVALAEQRLDDPILEQETPGELGASLQAAVRRLADSLADSAKVRQQLAHDAAHDGLTGLANRKAVLTHLEGALARGARSGATTAVLFLDLDDFKSINDSHGHHAGDEMLQTIAGRLTSSTRDGDLAGRLGGDEFIVVAEDVADVDEAISLSERIMSKINEPITFERTTFTPQISIGIGMSNDSLTADELVRDADLAVYRAKSRGRGVVDVCDESLRTMVIERAALEANIKTAILDDQFELYVQPVVNADNFEKTSYEALIRWPKVEGEMVFPDEFIPVAERSDLIVDIDQWVLGRAARLLAEWESDPNMAGVSLAVNISARHLSSGLLPNSVRDAIQANQIDPRLLVLEVTETALLDDLSKAATDLAILRAMGVGVALDDFGTGFMSLANLRTLSVDILKIDRSFVAELDSESARSIVQLTIDAGHLLGIKVTAEGVETQEQADVLCEMGADKLQGYFFGRPAPHVDGCELVAGVSSPG